jgi:hypothetical protein
MESDARLAYSERNVDSSTDCCAFRLLAGSSLYRIYHCAFSGGFGIPLRLIAPTEMPASMNGGPRAGEDCRVILRPDLPFLRKLPLEMGCRVAALPVPMGAKIIAWLVTQDTRREERVSQVRGESNIRDLDVSHAGSASCGFVRTRDQLSFHSALELLELIGVYLGGEMNGVILKQNGFLLPGALPTLELEERRALERARHELLFDRSRIFDDESLSRISGFPTAHDFRLKFGTYFYESPQCYRFRMLDCHRKMEAWKPETHRVLGADGQSPVCDRGKRSRSHASISRRDVHLGDESVRPALLPT